VQADVKSLRHSLRKAVLAAVPQRFPEKLRRPETEEEDEVWHPDRGFQWQFHPPWLRRTYFRRGRLLPLRACNARGVTAYTAGANASCDSTHASCSQLIYLVTTLSMEASGQVDLRGR